MTQKHVLVAIAVVVALAAIVGGGALVVRLAQRRPPPAPVASPPADDTTVAAPIDPAYLRPRPTETGSGSTEPDHPAVVDVRLGVCVPSTGPDAEYGTSVTRGARLQVDERARVAGSRYRIALGVEHVGKGNAGLERLYAGYPGRLAVVLGLGDEERALEQLPYFHRKRLLMFPLRSATRVLTDDTQVYAIGTEDDYYALSLLAMVEKLGWKRCNVLGDATPHGGRVSDAFAARAPKERLVVERTEVADAKRSGAAIAAKLGDSGTPDGLVLVSRDPLAMLEMVKALRDAGNALPVLLTDGAATKSFHDGARGLAPAFAIHVASAFDPTADHARAFSEAYARAHGHAPDVWAALAYDATALALACLEDAPENYEAGVVERAIRTRFTEAAPYLGATGPIHVDTRGRILARALTLLVWAPSGLAPHAAQLSVQERTAIELAANTPLPEPVAQVRPGEDVPGMGSGPGRMPGMGSGPRMGGPEGAETRPAIKAPPGHWYDDVEDALDVAMSADYPTLVLFHRGGEAVARAALAPVFADAAFLEEAAQWVLVAVDLDRHPAYRASHAIERTPLLVYWGAGACELGRHEGPIEAAGLVAEMRTRRVEADALIDQVAMLRFRVDASGHPDSPEAQLEAADFYLARRNYALATNYYQAALQLLIVANRRVESIAVYPRLLAAQEGAHFFAAALHSAEEWIRRDSEGALMPTARLLRGRYLIELGRIDEARSALRELRAQLGVDHPKSREAEQMFRGRVAQPLD